MKLLIEEVVTALRSGQVVLIPTDTVYGLVADPYSAVAMKRLFQIKARPEDTPIAMLVANLDQARKLVRANDIFESLALRHWPGALTLVATQLHPGSLHIGNDKTLGVRQPQNELLLRIIDKFGPIGATSANRHGQPVVTDFASARVEFGADVDLIVDGGRRDVIASTVVDLTTGTPNVLRQGVVSVRDTA